MKAIAAVAWLFLVAAPFHATAQEMTDAEQAQIEAEVKQAIANRWAGYINAGLKGFETWSPFWAPDIRILEPGMDLSGNEFMEFGRDFFESGGEVFSFEVESFEVWVHGDVAYQIGQFDESFQYAGEEPAEAHNYFFARWEKQPDGEWRISRLMAGPRDAPSEG